MTKTGESRSFAFQPYICRTRLGLAPVPCPVVYSLLRMKVYQRLFAILSVLAAMLTANAALASQGDTQWFLLGEQTLERLRSGATHLTIDSFPVTLSKQGTLELKRLHSVIDNTTKIEVTGKDGTRTIAGVEVISYRGYVRGEAGSLVEMSIVDGELIGSTEIAGVKYLFAPHPLEELKPRYLIRPQSAIYRDREQRSIGACESEFYDSEYGKGFQTQPPTPATLPSTLLQVNVAIDADYNFFKSTGADVNKTIAYIGTVFNFVSMIYEDETNITYHIPYIKIWTDSLVDPYKVAGNPFAMVDKVQTYWKANNGHIARDIVHGLTSTTWGGGGYAMFDVLCGDFSYGCSAPCGWLSYPTFDYTYDVYIIAHELGHMYGAVHSHDCKWNPPIDTCGVQNDDKYNYGDACSSSPIEPKPNPGSIMSYCLQINSDNGVPFNKLVEMTFTPKVAAVIREGAEEATCIAQPPKPTLVLRSPRGGARFKAGSTSTIEWSHAHVENVALSYSSDGMKTWSTIAPFLSASASSFEWMIPAITADERIYVRVVNTSDATVGDTSIMESLLEPSATAADRQAEERLILRVLPNPANNRAVCRITIPARNAGIASISLVDLSGIVFHRIEDLNLTDETIEVELDLKDVASGSYRVVLSTVAETIDVPLVILR
jgi:hypothetical protein